MALQDGFRRPTNNKANTQPQPTKRPKLHPFTNYISLQPRFCKSVFRLGTPYTTEAAAAEGDGSKDTGGGFTEAGGEGMLRRGPCV